MVDFAKTISVKRPNHKRPLIWLQYISYACFQFGINHSDIQHIFYLYLLTKFENFDSTQFAQILTYQSILSTIGLLVLIPLMSKVLKFNDITIQMIVCVTESLSLFLLTLAQNRWELYLIISIGMLSTCKSSILRSILTKSVNSNEIGKALSGLSIIAAAMPYITAPSIQGLYKATLGIFPASFVLLAGSLMLFAFEINGILYLNKEHIYGDEKVEGNDVNDKTKDFSSKYSKINSAEFAHF